VDMRNNEDGSKVTGDRISGKNKKSKRKRQGSDKSSKK